MILGVDLGTTNLKVVAVDGRLSVIASSRSRVANPSDPAEWWRSLKRALSALPNEPAEAIAISGMAPVMVPVLEDGSPGPVILYNDTRVAEALDRIAQLGKEFWLSLTGNPPTVQMMLPKILWLREREPRLFSRVSVVLDAAGFMAFRLTGRATVDSSTALEWGMLDLRKLMWSDDVLDAFGLSPSLLPEIVRPGEPIGFSKIEVGPLRRSTLVVAGTVDFLAGLVGAGVLEEGDWFVTYGTTSCIGAVSRNPRPSESFFLDLHPARGRYVVNGCMSLSGGSLEWLSKVLGVEQDALESVASELLRRPCLPLLFYPFLKGERTPFSDPHVRGAIFGLSDSVGPAELYAALVVGIAMAVRHHVELIKELGVPLRRLVGIGSRRSLLVKVVSDACGIDQNLFDGPAEAFGSALLAAVGAGVAGWEDVADLPRSYREVRHSEDSKPYYDGIYSVYLTNLKLVRRVSRSLLRLSAGGQKGRAQRGCGGG